MAVIWNTFCKKVSFKLETSNQFFKNYYYYINFQDMQSFFF